MFKTWGLNQSKPQPKPRPSSLNPPPISIDGTISLPVSVPSPASWICNHCSLINENDSDVCDVCLNYRVINTLPTVPISNGSVLPIAQTEKVTLGEIVSPIRSNIHNRPIYSVHEFISNSSAANSTSHNSAVTVRTEIRSTTGELLVETESQQTYKMAQQVLLRFTSINNSDSSSLSVDQKSSQSAVTPVQSNSSPQRSSLRTPVRPVDEESTPAFSLKNGLHGKPDYVENEANAGRLGGERVTGGEYQRSTELYADSIPVDNSGLPPNVKKQGPRQVPTTDEISLTMRRQQQLKELADGGGYRVNQDTAARQYTLGGYEKSVYIDPNRHEYAKKTENANIPTVRNSSALEDVGVPYEVASVGAKVRNMLLVSGERVKEMDHFVANVKTPVVIMKLSSNDENGNPVVQSAAKNTEIGAYIQQATKSKLLQRANSIALNGCLNESGSTLKSSSSPLLLVEEQYATPVKDLKSGSEIVPDYILKYSVIFWNQVLMECYHILGLKLDEHPIQLYYIATMRADELVCSMSGNLLYVNALVFQQSSCCVGDNVAADGVIVQGATPSPTKLHSHRLKEILSHWTMRIAIAKSKFVHSSNSTVDQKPIIPPGQKPTGLYDPVIRRQFYKRLDVLLAKYK